jgi:streptomycin 3"-adenylyltransferase
MLLGGDPLADQTRAVAAVVGEVLGTAVLGLYRYGSAEVGGLRPESDLDLFGVIARRTTKGERRALVAGLGPTSRRLLRPPGWRPVELTLVVRDEVRPWRWPPRLDVQYGEWLRAAFDAGDLAPWPPANPDVAMLVTMVRQHGRSLLGPPATLLLDEVPPADLRRAIRDEVPSLLADLEDDTRNVLLTLARMWVTVATGDMVPKEAAAAWAAARLPAPEASVVRRAGDAYLAGGDDRWEREGAAVGPAAERMAAEIRSLTDGTAPPDRR